MYYAAWLQVLSETKYSGVNLPKTTSFQRTKIQ